VQRSLRQLHQLSYLRESQYTRRINIIFHRASRVAVRATAMPWPS
jgi:hypothetical protein